jgi:hypothetical protein
LYYKIAKSFAIYLGAELFEIQIETVPEYEAYYIANAVKLAAAFA